MASIVEQIIAAGDMESPWLWAPDPGPWYAPPDSQHPLGRLFLTDTEMRQVLDHFGIATPTSMSMWGIPVEIIDSRPDECSETEHLTRQENP